MKIREKWIPLAQAQVGMILSEVIHDQRGQILLMPNTVLNEANISGLKRRNISSIPIQHQDHRTEEELEQERAETIKKVNDLFAFKISSSSLDGLQRLILEYRLKELT